MDTFLRFGLGNAAMATLLAALAAVAGRFLRGRPAVRHGLWLLVLVKLMTPPVTVVPVAWPAPPARTDRAETVATVAQVETSDEIVAEPPLFVVEATERPAMDKAISEEVLGRSVARLVAILWLVGTVLTIVVTCRRVRRWNRVLERLEPAPAEIQDRVDLLAIRMGLPRGPGVWWSAGSSGPLLWAFGAIPRLIVPETLWERLDERQRTTLLVHELAHLRRRDHWVRLLEILATAFYWWLPLVWIARRALREAEEQCCDAWVVWACPDKIRTYAETLLETVEFLSESQPVLPLAASGFGQVHHLKRRISMIMQGTTPRTLGWTGMLGMFGLSAMLLPLSPTWAQDPGNKEETKPEPVVAAPAEPAKETTVEAVLPKLAAVQDAIRFVVVQKDDEDDSEKEEKTEAKEEKLKDLERHKAELEKMHLKLMHELHGLQGEKAKAIVGAKLKAEEAARKAVEGVKATSIPEAELRRARSEVERARAALKHAEERLARLQTGGKGNFLFKADRTVGPFLIEKDDKREVPARIYTLRKTETTGPTPERDHRLAEIEKRLDQLVNEVKSLREKPREQK